jgi:hypothetical protein
LAEAIRAEVGDNGELLIKQLLAIINGRYGTWGKVDAIKEAFNRGWGRALQTVTIEAPKPDPDQEWRRLLEFATDAELDQLKVFAEYRTKIYATLRDREAASKETPPTDGQEGAKP